MLLPSCSYDIRGICRKYSRQEQLLWISETITSIKTVRKNRALSARVLLVLIICREIIRILASAHIRYNRRRVKENSHDGHDKPGLRCRRRAAPDWTFGNDATHNTRYPDNSVPWHVWCRPLWSRSGSWSLAPPPPAIPPFLYVHGRGRKRPPPAESSLSYLAELSSTSPPSWPPQRHPSWIWTSRGRWSWWSLLRSRILATERRVLQSRYRHPGSGYCLFHCCCRWWRSSLSSGLPSQFVCRSVRRSR